MNRAFRINDTIVAPQVHLIDETGKSFGIVGRDQALYLAWQKELDLVEIGPNANPPVVKIIDHGKFLYQQQKKEQKQKAQAKTTEVKQIRLSPTIESHDLETKAKHAREFLEEGHKVRVSILLRGRQRALAGRAQERIRQFSEMVNGQLENPPRQLGNMLFGVISKK